jgi:predicted DNA-binding protein
MRQKKYPQWYKTTGLKHVTGFLTPTEKQKMKRLAAAADKSLSRYVTRLMQQHIRDMEAVEMRRALEERNRGD